MDSGNLPETEARLLFDSSIDWVCGELTCGKDVRIRGFGSFELKMFPGNTTVFFITDNGLSLEQDNEAGNKGFPFFFRTFKELLMQGEVVNIENLGTFRKAGDYGRISFIPSARLRDSLLGVKDFKDLKDIKNLEEFKETAPVKVEKIVAKEEKIAPIEDEKEETAGVVEEPRKEILTTPVFPNVSRTSTQSGEKENEKFCATTDEKQNFLGASGEKKKNRYPLFIGFGVCVIAVLFVIIFRNFGHISHLTGKPEETHIREEVTASEPSHTGTPNTLLDLAELHYGNRVFWIYLYDANKEILKSPLQQVGGLDLKIPDLKTEYGVNPQDTAEIRRAGLSGKMIMEILKTNNN